MIGSAEFQNRRAQIEPSLISYDSLCTHIDDTCRRRRERQPDIEELIERRYGRGNVEISGVGNETDNSAEPRPRQSVKEDARDTGTDGKHENKNWRHVELPGMGDNPAPGMGRRSSPKRLGDGNNNLLPGMGNRQSSRMGGGQSPKRLGDNNNNLLPGKGNRLSLEQAMSITSAMNMAFPDTNPAEMNMSDIIRSRIRLIPAMKWICTSQRACQLYQKLHVRSNRFPMQEVVINRKVSMCAATTTCAEIVM